MLAGRLAFPHNFGDCASPNALARCSVTPSGFFDPEFTALIISVIIPTCHRNDLLACALEALSPVVQQFPSDQYEVIVSDDGRHFTAEEMIKSHYPSIKWIKGPGCGPAANRNNGARAAGAKWLVFTDDDCVPETGWLSAYAAAIRSLASSVYEGRTYTEKNTKGPFWGAPCNESGGLLWSCNMAIRADVFFSLGGFDALFPFPHLEDVDLRKRLRGAGHDFLFCPEAAVFHPLRPVASVTRQAIGHESYFYFARKHGLTLKQSGLSVRVYLKARVMWFSSSRGLLDSVRFVTRSAAEAILVACMSIWWLVKFRSVKKAS